MNQEEEKKLSSTKLGEGSPKLRLGEGLPNLGLDMKKPFGGEGNANKIFNIRIPPITISRLKILKEDIYLNKITWNEFLEMVILLVCQGGMVSRETIERLRGIADWERSIPKEAKGALGIGIHWSEVGPIILSLRKQMEGVRESLSLVEEALYEFATAIEASEEAEVEEGEDFDQSFQEVPDGDLFGLQEQT